MSYGCGYDQTTFINTSHVISNAHPVAGSLVPNFSLVGHMISF